MKKLILKVSIHDYVLIIRSSLEIKDSILEIVNIILFHNISKNKNNIQVVQKICSPGTLYKNISGPASCQLLLHQ